MSFSLQIERHGLLDRVQDLHKVLLFLCVIRVLSLLEHERDSLLHLRAYHGLYLNQRSMNKELD